ncbi:hypothetical protein [Enterococcus timonensis]|uniref:hypothetical protein n=1 Tax=Enterococcus timonensis TaxID=1852364 RepID=UPI0008D9F2B9|nr:hypothetical protein [Enterococcus timonensis]
MNSNNLVKNFQNPPHEYSQFPFWFWNGEITKEGIYESIHEFYQRHIYGFVIHPRMGLSENIPYLSETFFSLVTYAVQVAAQLEMKVILYDEGMYPSGSAHGEVVRKNPEFAAQGLALYTQEEFTNYSDEIIEIWQVFKKEQSFSMVENKYSKKWYLVYAYSKGTVRGLYDSEDDGQENAPKAANLLDSQAVASFIHLTHDRYFKHLANFFGSTIIGFFTDEPSILGRNHRKTMLPFKKETAEILQNKIGSEKLATLFTAEKNSDLYKSYAESVEKDLTENYYRPLAQWCQNHGIALMGHPASGMDIGVLDYFGVPGQDMVWRFVSFADQTGIVGRESTAGKCSADSARHQGKRKNSNEVFGACGSPHAPWDLTMQEMQWYLNWLFVRGVNLIFPHAFFYSIDGKRRDERPPDVGPHNLWWNEYGKFAQYSNRLSYLLTDCVNQTNIAVLTSKTFLPYEEVQSLYQQQIEFNYLEKELLFSKGKFVDGRYELQQQSYDTILATKDCGLSDSEITFLESNGLKIIYLKKEQEVLIAQAAKNRPHITGENLSQLRFSKIKKDQETFYLFFNEGQNPLHFHFEKDLPASLWSANSGEIFAYHNEEITLQPAEMKIFSDSLAQEKLPDWYEVGLTYQIKSRPLALTKLQNWAEIQADYSGSNTYDFVFHFEKEVFGEVLFDFGKVNDILIYEKSRQVSYAPPYTVKISIEEPTKELSLTVIVKNSLTNTYDNNPRLSGIIGPIQGFMLGDY